ncbi:MAG: CHAT domain-containing protein, partial [Merismopedia sp. SIO2A8]|nr:CHAT domain-containing protein [Merismopedia sp. SIO2A8]
GDQGGRIGQGSELLIWVRKPTGEAAFRRVDLAPIWQQQNAYHSSLGYHFWTISTITNLYKEALTRNWHRQDAITSIILLVGGIIGFALFGRRLVINLFIKPLQPLKRHWLFFWLFSSLVATVGGGGLFSWEFLSLMTDLSYSNHQSIFFAEQLEQSEQLQQLHQLLIQPIADLLPSDPNAHVIFIPPEPLLLVPFPALQDTSGQYLIEKHTLRIAPSIQLLDLTRQQRQHISGLNEEALIVGNPTMPIFTSEIGQPPEPLPSLPGTQQEAKAIAQLLDTTPLMGNQATKKMILQRMPKARIIHLATHGLWDDFQGLWSTLALAPTDDDSGLLTAAEIRKLPLNAELVVLSACDTGRGRITGEGVIGLSHSFISAGVPSVIVSLWSVPEAPTAELMTEFYRQRKHTQDLAQALRQAMLATLKENPNPIDWAGFTLIGESKAITAYQRAQKLDTEVDLNPNTPEVIEKLKNE